MAIVSRIWPFINPMSLDKITVDWWNYYVRAAKKEIERAKP